MCPHKTQRRAKKRQHGTPCPDARPYPAFRAYPLRRWTCGQIAFYDGQHCSYSLSHLHVLMLMEACILLQYDSGELYRYQSALPRKQMLLSSCHWRCHCLRAADLASSYRSQEVERGRRDSRPFQCTASRWAAYKLARVHPVRQRTRSFASPSLALRGRRLCTQVV